MLVFLPPFKICFLGPEVFFNSPRGGFTVAFKLFQVSRTREEVVSSMGSSSLPEVDDEEDLKSETSILETWESEN